MSLERLEERCLLAVFSVTSASDDLNLPGTLRAAIEGANASAGADEIQFALTAQTGFTITLSRALPTIDETVVINGFSQSGSGNSQPVVTLTGGGSLDANGLTIRAPDVVVAGLAINGFQQDGIRVEGPRAVIRGNYIGVDLLGTSIVANQGAGVRVVGVSGAVIGGDAVEDRNIISGNLEAGVVLTGSGATQALVINNSIGVDLSGNTALANGVGIEISDGARFNTVGGGVAGRSNVISGNTSHGIVVTGAATQSNVIQGNRIGVNTSASVALANDLGVYLNQSPGNVIGGTLAGQGNVIAGNRSAGVRVEGVQTASILGNFIGTNSALADRLGNGGPGVRLLSSSSIQIGSLSDGGGNTISGNNGGVILDDGSVNNPILSNSIFLNTGLGIDLGGNGPDNNDQGDGDTGANNHQNFPVLTRASTAAGRTLVQGSLSSTPNASFLIQFFTNPAVDDSGRGEGRTLVGSITVTTSGSGVAIIDATLDTPTSVGDRMTATATTLPADQGNTSEFNAPITIVEAQVADLSVSITKEDSGAPLPLDQALINVPYTYVVKVTNNGPSRATNVRMTQILPTAVEVLSISTTQGSVVQGPSGLTGNLGAIESGATVEIRVEVNPIFANPAATTTVTVSSSELDPVTIDNTAVYILRIVNPGNLSIQAETESSPVTEGGVLVQRVLITNNGPSLASNVVLTTMIPANVSFLGTALGQGECTLVPPNNLTCDIGSIAFGATVTLRLFLQASTPGDVIQTFTVSSPDDPDETDNTATTSAVIVPGTNLNVQIEANPVQAVTGQTISYDVTIGNAGPRTATGVVLTSDLPDGLDLVSVSVNGVLVPGATDPLSIAVGTIVVGGTANVRIVATPNSSGSGIVTTTVVVSADQGDLVLDDNTASADIDVNPVDLEITQTATPNPVLAGQELVYLVTVRNLGLATATNVLVENILPSNVSFVRADIVNGVGTLTSNGATLEVAFASLAANAVAQIEIVVLPAESVEFTNIATVKADENDPDKTNNFSSLTLVASPADVLVLVSPLPGGTIYVNDPISLVYTVGNNGPVTASATMLTLPLPPGLAFVSATTTQGTVGVESSGATVSANLGTIGVGPAAVATVTIIVRATTAGSFAPTATVVSAELDNNPGNNAASVSFNTINTPGVLQFQNTVFTASENSGVAIITVTRTNGTLGNVSVSYATQGGTAVPGVNYTPVNGTLDFLDGQSTATFNVPLIGDGIITPNLTVGLALSDPTGAASLGSTSTAVLQIVNTDLDLVPPTVTSLSLAGRGSSIQQIQLNFSEALAPNRAANLANYTLFNSRGVAVRLAGADYVPGSLQVLLQPASALPANAFFRVVVNGQAPNGLTDVNGNYLAGNGQSAGTDYVSTFGRGTNFSFIDSDGDAVNLRLARGGVLEVIRSANGDVQTLRATGYSRRSILSGSVRRTRNGGNGSTVIGQIENIPFGSLQSRLTSPPFFVSVQYGNLTPPVQIASVPGLRRWMPSRFRAR